MESDLSTVYMKPVSDEATDLKDIVDGRNVTLAPILDTLVVNCTKLELRSDHIMVKIDPDKMDWVKKIIINGRKYILEEE